ncbi:MAG: OmpA-OmpF porin, family, partial [Bradyrhizobium sp.]|nr:OmpA-OmpF porin, family [Bradyrhizobium sp.]
MGFVRLRDWLPAGLRHTLVAFVLLLGLEADAAINSQEINRHQAIRDSLFKNLRTATTQYSFDYVVIYLPPGTLPGIDIRIPVSHIRFKSTVFFEFNKYSLEQSAESATLDMAKTILNDTSARSVLVVGHTDAIGPDQYNSTLSLNRAVAVASKLREAGINDKFLGVVPMGEAQPVATNRTPEGRA